MDPLFYYGVSLVFGLCIGSFLNVCIYRVPNNKSIVSPPSSCPGCGSQIRFYDNIPILSYLILMGKCRTCAERISIRYPLVELITGLFSLAVFIKIGLEPGRIGFGDIAEGLIYFAFIAALIVITFIDIDLQIIPDVISLPGIPIFFLLSLLIPDVTLLDSVLGILLGGGSLFIIAKLWEWIRHIEAMGFGDVKLLAMIGALIGWQGVLFTIFVGSTAGTLAGLPIMLGQKQNLQFKIPFGPFLSIGAISYIFFGPELIGWYFSQLR